MRPKIHRPPTHGEGRAFSQMPVGAERDPIPALVGNVLGTTALARPQTLVFTQTAGVVMTESHDGKEQVRRVFFAPGVLGEEEAFRDRLTALTHTGLGGRRGPRGRAGACARALWGLLGRPTTWGYPASMSADVFVLWDKTAVVGVCLGAVGLGRTRCRLSGGAGGTALALAAAVVSLTHDAYRGILSVEYLVLVYLLAVAVVPYRPWQALLFVLGLTTVFYGLGHYGLPVSKHLFVGARAVLAEELLALLNPPERMWEVGGLAGVQQQGPHGQVSLASGLVVAKTQTTCYSRCDGHPYGKQEHRTAGIPIDVQLTWSPNPHVGVGLHVYTTITRRENRRGFSLQVTGRIPK